MATVNLTVRSVNNVNCTPYSQMFETEHLHGVRANQNLNNAITVTEAGDTQNIMSAWTLTTGIGSGIYENQILYWTFQSSGTTRTVRIYGNSTRTWLLAEGEVVIANGAAGTCFFTGVRDHNVAGSVLITIGGGGADDDTDAANTLTVTNVTLENDLQLNGASEFIAIENREMKTKYTVTETVAQITAAAGVTPAADQYVVFFKVTAGQYGSALAGATVTFGDEEATTDASGYAYFVASDGDYAWYVEPNDVSYTGQGGTAEVDGDNLTVEVELEDA